MTQRWKDAIAKDPRLSIADAMQQEIEALRKDTDALQLEVSYRRKDVEMFQTENIEQWDEIVMLREDAKQHEEIVAIYLNKITRLKNESSRSTQKDLHLLQQVTAVA